MGGYIISGMNKRRDLTQTEKDDARRLQEQFLQAKEAASDRGEKLTQAVLADRLNWSSQSPVSQYMTGKIPLNVKAVLQFSRALNVPPETISPTLAREAETPSFDANTTANVAKPGRIPLVSWVNAGCWSEAIDLHEVGDAEEWIVFGDDNTNKNAYALRVHGESMHDPVGPASFSDGDIIIVDPDKTPENKSYVVVRQNGNMEATFKQLIIESGEKMLKALNPSWPNRIIPMTEETELCGVVIARYTTF